MEKTLTFLTMFQQFSLGAWCRRRVGSPPHVSHLSALTQGDATLLAAEGEQKFFIREFWDL